ncbi:MAG: nicotinate-nucleotide--dimethylbenzimidazole phosphoribosyltransferase [Anaerolineales bacterium]|nr:nicotinate-nucleotide--dimethylbenzimidazole phosphoribosyltransferase [Anaerolineales bacterium]
MMEYTMEKLDELVGQIKPLDQDAMTAARERQNTLTKPPGSLGRLEELSIQLAGIQRKPIPEIEHKVIVVMAGDHGVVAEGVSAYPSEVTPQMVSNMLHGGAAVNVLSRYVEVRIKLVDMGVDYNFEPNPELEDKKVARGTQNIAVGAAMTREQALAAILSGAEVVEAEYAEGLDILATGEMGIGNTTPSAAICAVLTGKTGAEVAGRGTGVDDAGLARKAEVIDRALEVNQPEPKDALDVLSKVGGYEIGGLTGAILAAAAHGCPVVIDGFISTAAAMLAVTLVPQVGDYLIAAHHSQEQGHAIMLDWLEIKPLLSLDMHLGEGTGAVLGISLAEAACRILKEMATFAEAGVSDKDA